MTKDSALIVSLATIIGVVVLGVGFSTGFFHPEPLTSPNGLGQNEAAIVATATSKDAPSLMRHAQDHLALGEYKEAIVFLRLEVQLNPKDVTAQKTLASAAFQVKDMILAANTCHELTQLTPTDADAQLGLAKALYVLSLLPDSAAACRAVLTLTVSDVSSPLRVQAKQVLQRIPLREQRKVPEAVFPIVAAD